MTYTLIAHTELGSAQAAITFSSIPATFTDLELRLSLRSTLAAVPNYFFLKINGSTTTFSFRGLFGTGSTTGSFTSPSNYGGESTGANSTADTFGSTTIYFANYRLSQSKSFSLDSVGENNGTNANQVIGAGLWATNTAINSIELESAGSNFTQFSSATLYGITSGSSGGVVVS